MWRRIEKLIKLFAIVAGLTFVLMWVNDLSVVQDYVEAEIAEARTFISDVKYRLSPLGKRL
jgi:hypothetical protein